MKVMPGVGEIPGASKLLVSVMLFLIRILVIYTQAELHVSFEESRAPDMDLQ